MSAYLVDKAVIDALVGWADEWQVANTLREAELAPYVTPEMVDHEGEFRDLLGGYLWGVNAWSVMTRYPDITVSTMDRMPGGPDRPEWTWGYRLPLAVYSHTRPEWGFWDERRAAMAPRLLGAIGTYEYQSCEFEEYQQSAAHHLMGELALSVSLHLSLSFEGA